MEKTDRAKIQANLKTLVKIDNIQSLVDRLIDDGVIYPDFYQRIQAETQYPEDQNRDFFLKYTKRGPTAFGTLIQALKELGYKHEASVLEGSVQREGSTSSLESQSSSSLSSSGIGGSGTGGVSFVNSLRFELPRSNGSSSPTGSALSEPLSENLETHSSNNVLPPIDASISGLDLRTDSLPLPPEVKRATLYNQGETDPAKTYHMMSNPKGFALIINNIEFEGDIDNEYRRVGAEKDSVQLRNLLVALGFQVYVHHNVHKDELINPNNGIFNRFKQRFENANVDCCVVAVMSHGYENYIRMSDSMPSPSRGEYTGNYVRVYEDVVYAFNNHNCPALSSKPKIFLLQSCRGKNRDKGFRRTEVDGKAQPVVQQYSTESDALSFLQDSNYHPSNGDILICFATVPGFVSNRDTIFGTWYIQTFCETVAQHAHDTEILDILREVDRRMREITSEHGEKQISSFKSIGFCKRFYFNPGLYANGPDI